MTCQSPERKAWCGVDVSLTCQLAKRNWSWEATKHKQRSAWDNHGLCNMELDNKGEGKRINNSSYITVDWLITVQPFYIIIYVKIKSALCTSESDRPNLDERHVDGCLLQIFEQNCPLSEAWYMCAFSLKKRHFFMPWKMEVELKSQWHITSLLQIGTTQFSHASNFLFLPC